MAQAVPAHGDARWQLWADGCAGLGYRTAGPEPATKPLAAGVAAVATGRLDNRTTLIGQLAPRIGRTAASPVTDADLLVSAYRRWQSEAPIRLMGDWAFAAWHPDDLRLFVARDHFGNTSLYYYVDRGVCAFSTSRAALLALDAVPKDIDELYLAQVLVSWYDSLGDRTVHRHIRQLPPAHTFTLSPDGLRVRRYWKMEDVRELRPRSRGEYVEGFREVFDEAVRVRLPDSGQVGISLSGGLDSSAVAASAARSLAPRKERLVAFTSVPLYDTAPYVGNRFGDEFDLASATANAVGPIHMVPVPAATWTPVEALRKTLRIIGEPIHAAANLYWLIDLLDAARRLQCATLLTGQMGNAGISWTGDPLSQSVRYQLRNLGIRTTARSWLHRKLPRRFMRARVRNGVDPEWYRRTAISPSFAQRLDLLGLRMSDPDQLPPRGGLEERLRIFTPRSSAIGAFIPTLSDAFEVELRDPTADVRVISFTLAIPDRVYIDPGSGLDRWLIREAMSGLLPDQVRLNRNRGRQAGDLVPRLRASGDEVDVAFDELGAGPAAEYLDVAYMRDVWRTVQSVDSADTFRKAGSILMRGMMVGLYVNGLA